MVLYTTELVLRFILRRLTRLQFLPYHWLLAAEQQRYVSRIFSLQGNLEYQKYQDVFTGQLLIGHRTKLGACNAMTQNLHNAICQWPAECRCMLLSVLKISTYVLTVRHPGIQPYTF